MEPNDATEVTTTYGDIRRSQDLAFEKGEIAGERRARLDLISILSAIKDNPGTNDADRSAVARVLVIMKAVEEESFSPSAVAKLAGELGEKAGRDKAIITIREALARMGVAGVDPLGHWHWLDPLGRSKGRATGLEVENV